MSEGPAKATVRVTIFGEEYAIRSDAPEEYTVECARYVDEAVQKAHVHGQVAESHRAAVLAALQITDELFRAREELSARIEDLVARLGVLRASVESTVEAGAGGLREAD